MIIFVILLHFYWDDYCKDCINQTSMQLRDIRNGHETLLFIHGQLEFKISTSFSNICFNSISRLERELDVSQQLVGIEIWHHNWMFARLWFQM